MCKRVSRSSRCCPRTAYLWRRQKRTARGMPLPVTLPVAWLTPVPCLSSFCDMKLCMWGCPNEVPNAAALSLPHDPGLCHFHLNTSHVRVLRNRARPVMETGLAHAGVPRVPCFHVCDFHGAPSCHCQHDSAMSWTYTDQADALPGLHALGPCNNEALALSETGALPFFRMNQNCCFTRTAIRANFHGQL